MKNWTAFLRRVSQTLLLWVLGLLLTIPFLALFAWMFVVPPIAVLWESIDLVRMQGVAPGKILDVTYVSGKKLTDRARITYAFSVAGQRYVSDRYLAGFAGNNSTWTGGAAVGASFPVGRQVLVHFRPGDPTLCALEYGWFKWSVAPTFLCWGLALIAFAALRMQPSSGATCLRCIGITLAVSGFCEIAIGPAAIRVRELHWHCLAWCGVLGGVVLYVWGEKRFALPEIGANGLSPDIENADQSTSLLVFELVCGIALLAQMIEPIWNGIPLLRALIRALGDGITDISRILEKLILLSFLLMTIAFPLVLASALLAFFQKVFRRIAWHWAHPKNSSVSARP